MGQTAGRYEKPQTPFMLEKYATEWQAAVKSLRMQTRQSQ